MVARAEHAGNRTTGRDKPVPYDPLFPGHAKPRQRASIPLDRVWATFPTSMPASLNIHPGPARAVEAAVGILSAWIDIEHLRLGGGTALEARWHHRASTDLDFFAHGTHADALFYEKAEDMVADLERLATEGAISSQNIRLTARNIIHFNIGDTPVSLGRTEMFHDDPREEVESRTGVVLSGIKDILTKKMCDRLGYNQLATERDAYDFIVARTKAPEDLAYAWGMMSGFMKEAATGMYRELAQDSGPALELDDARYGNIAADLWSHVVRMFESNLEYVPPLSLGESDQGSGGHGR